MILFLFLVLAYKYILHTPLLKVLAERRQRTLGAVEKANEAIAAVGTMAGSGSVVPMDHTTCMAVSYTHLRARFLA